MHGWDGSWHGHYGAIWMMIAILGGLVVLSFWLARTRGGGDREPPERVLKRRFASGEIDENTYEHMLEELRK